MFKQSMHKTHCHHYCFLQDASLHCLVYLYKTAFCMSPFCNNAMPFSCAIMIIKAIQQVTKLNGAQHYRKLSRCYMIIHSIANNYRSIK